MNQPETTRSQLIKALTAPGMPHELLETNSNGTTVRIFKNAPLTIRQMLEESRQFDDRIYLQYEEERYSFLEVYRLVSRLACRLVDDFGIKKGDRVAIAMRNYPEWVISYMAIVSVGGIAVALNSWWNTHEMEYGIGDCGASLIFVDQERLDNIAELIGVMGLYTVVIRPVKPLPESCIHWDALISDNSDPKIPEVNINPEDDAVILYTSGSTGHPKGAVSTHRAVIHAIISWELDRYCGLARLQEKVPPDIDSQFIPSILMAVPLFHVSGSHVGMLSYLRNGGKMVLMYRWDVGKAMDIIESNQITQFTAVPTMTGDLVQAARLSGRKLSSLLAVGGGGASRDPAQVKAIASDLDSAAPGTGWGMTETNAIGAQIGGEDYLKRPTSSGQCSAVLEFSIIDENGNALGSGQRGELLVRGTSLFRAYWNKPEATSESFTDHWFHTGDVAVIDEEGFLYIVDRIKNLVIRGGENIGCGEVEAAIYEHPDVVEAIVFGVPDERLGEEVAAVVVLKSNSSIDAQLLKDFLKEWLADFQIPRYLYFQTEPLLRIASGKFDKRNMRERILKTYFSNNPNQNQNNPL